MTAGSKTSTDRAASPERRRVTCHREECDVSFDTEVIPFTGRPVQRFCGPCTPLAEAEQANRFAGFIGRHADRHRERAIRDARLQRVHLDSGAIELTDSQRLAENSIDRALAGESWGVALVGPPGTGKSLLASRGVLRYIEGELGSWRDACIAQADLLGDPVISARYAPAREIALAARASYTSTESEMSVLDSYASTRLLVIDDLGTERLSAHSLACLLHVVDARWSSRRPLVITTNLRPSEIAGRIAGADDEIAARRLVDRLTDLNWITITGQSWRGRKKSEVNR
jgi:DNA replication protein DnaC